MTSYGIGNLGTTILIGSWHSGTLLAQLMNEPPSEREYQVSP